MTNSRISIAVSALGGQGGGVLSGWIVELAEANGYIAQYTAIAGVAQRTGATIYAIELFPEEVAKKEGREPILSLMSVPGDVDICLASELMEAGRAVNRGLVTSDRTTLIASDHRVYAISEKEELGDGRLNSDTVKGALQTAAKKLILFDMNEMVIRSSSVISSVLFGALAGSQALPFSRDAFEQTIKNSGRSVETNLAGFELGFEGAMGETIAEENISCGSEVLSTSLLLERINKFPNEAQAIITYGVHRLVDYQDGEYAKLYLDRLEGLNGDLLVEVARYLALWMGFEDVVRVADLKTRAQRSDKISSEIHATKNQIWYGHDYFHPRFEEFTDILPSGLGRFTARSSLFKKLLSPLFSKGRIIRPKTILGYILLRSVAKLRFMRRSTLRYQTEDNRIVAWLNLVKKYATDNPELAIEIALCPRLIKGYGDTHARGVNRFSRIMAYVDQNEDAEKIAELRDCALLSDTGAEFNKCLNENNGKGLTSHDAQEGEFNWAGSF